MLREKLNLREDIPLWPIWLTIIFHLMASFYSSGFFHFDEHFQILEFLSYFNGQIDGSSLPWEFEERMRSWVQPLFYFLLERPFTFIGLKNPFFHTWLFRFSTSALSLLTTWIFWSWIRKDFNQKGEKAFIFISCLLWFLPFLHARHSSEAFSAIFFISGVSLYFISNRYRYTFLSGLLMMIGAFARFQMAIPILGLCAWLLVFRREEYKKMLVLWAGLICSLILCIGIDSLGYGTLTITPWNYFEQNLLKNKVSNFGINPWYDYLKYVVTRSFLPIGIVILVSLGFFWKRFWKHPITWLTIPFIVIHQLIGHKELRFLFPFIIFIPYFMAILFQEFSCQILKWKKSLVVIGAINCLLLFIYSVKTAHPSYNLYQYLYNTKKESVPLYYLGHLNPYRMADLPTLFFKKDHFEINKIDDDFSIENLENDFFWIFVNRGKYLKKMSSLSECQMKYSNYPKNILEIEIGKWPTKNKVWVLYRCQK